MTTTWQETIEDEPPDPPPLSHQYERDLDVAVHGRVGRPLRRRAG